MSLSKKIDMRWPSDLVDLINDARGDQTFSDFVREAARDKALATSSPPPAATLLDDPVAQASGQNETGHISTPEIPSPDEEEKTEECPHHFMHSPKLSPLGNGRFRCRVCHTVVRL